MMTNEDQELFLEMLLKLDETHDSIKAASKWCRANAACHEEIVRMWFFAVVKSQTSRRRLYLFHLASDILFTAEPSSMQYFSSFLPQLFKAVPFVRSEEIRIDMKKLFSIWRDKKIYNKVIIKRLNKSLKNRNKVVDMIIFKYDRDLLFKNLKRVQDLNPACDYLSRGVDFAPSFDNSQALLSTIKERRACQSLLASVDSHKSKVTSLVSYMEEMVHLLKMATTTLDLAGNKEQNGVEETKIRILAYGRFENTIRDVLSALETKWGFTRNDYAKPITPASPEPEEENLYSRRVGTVGVSGDPRMAGTPTPPVIIPAVPVTPPISPAIPPVPIVPPVISSWRGAPQLPLGEPEDVFTRRNRAGSMTPRRDDIVFTNPAPPSLATDDLPFACPRPPPQREPLLYASPRVVRDELPFASPHPNTTPKRDSLWLTPRSQRSMTPLLDEPLETPRLSDDPWDTSRVHQQEDPWDTPRPHRSQDEPWDTPRPHARDEPWSVRPHTAKDEVFNAPRRHITRAEPWSPRTHAAREEILNTPKRLSPRDELRSPRPHAAGEEVFDTPRPHTSRDEPWGRPQKSTPTRDKPWSPISPLYTGASSWGPPLKKPVYMPCYTGFHLETQEKQSMPPPAYKASYSRDKAPPQRPLSRSLIPDNSQRPEPLLPDPPRPIPLLGDRPQLIPELGTLPPLLAPPKASSIPLVTSVRRVRKNHR